MKYISIVFLCAISLTSGALDIKDFLDDRPLTTKGIVEDLLLYFQQDDPSGIPVLNIPDPLKFPGPFELAALTSTVSLKNVSIYGHSGFKLEHVGVKLQDLKVELGISFPFVTILSEYSIGAVTILDYPSAGDTNLSLTHLAVGLDAHFNVNQQGFLEIAQVNPKVEYEELTTNFTGLSSAHGFVISFIEDSFDSFVSIAMQNYISSQVLMPLNTLLRERLGERKFPVDISPVDFAAAVLRRQLARTMKLDPHVIQQFEYDLPLPSMSLVLKDIAVEGISTIHRNEEISVDYTDNVVYAAVEVSTKEITLKADWSVFSSLFPISKGQATFAIDGVSISVRLRQDADIRHPPILKHIDIQLGNLALRSKGDRALDYSLEALVNIFPNILKNMIMDRKVEGMIKQRVQDEFNMLDLEQLARDRIDKMPNVVLISP